MMFAIMRKELRESIAAGLAAIGLAVILAVGNVLFRWQAPDYSSGIAATVWLVLSFPLAFLGGGSAIAREARPNLIFLNSWPYGRSVLFLAKLLVSFVVTSLVIVAGFLICLSVADFKQAGVKDMFGDRMVWPMLTYWLLGCYGLALMWSAAVRTTLGATALGLVTASAIVAAFTLYVGFYLPTYWGPYVGHFPAPDPYLRIEALLLFVFGLMASAAALIRYPILETRRRVLCALAILGVSLVLLLGGLTVWQVVFRRPSLPRPIINSELADSGRTLVMQTAAGPDDPGGVWALPVNGGSARLVARGGDRSVLPRIPVRLGGPAITLQYGPEYKWSTWWAADVVSGRVWRLKGEPAAPSPDGRLWEIGYHKRLAIQDDRGRIVATLPSNAEYGTFSPDSRQVYYEGEPGVIEALDLQSGQVTTVKRFGYPVMIGQTSPDGSLLVLTAFEKPAPTSWARSCSIWGRGRDPLPQHLSPTRRLR